YHPTLEAYLAAKLRLFTDLIEPGGAAVIAADHEHADAVTAAATRRRLRLISVGRRGDGIRLIETRIEGFAQVIELSHAGRGHRAAPCRGRARPGWGPRWARRGSSGRRGATPPRPSPRLRVSKAPRAASSSSANAMARRSSSIMLTNPTHSLRRSRRCGPTS